MIRCVLSQQCAGLWCYLLVSAPWFSWYLIGCMMRIAAGNLSMESWGLEFALRLFFSLPLNGHAANNDWWVRGWEERPHGSLDCYPFRRTSSNGRWWHGRRRLGVTLSMLLLLHVCRRQFVPFKNTVCPSMGYNHRHMMHKDELHFFGFTLQKGKISLEPCRLVPLTSVETECAQQWSDSLTPTSLNHDDNASPSFIASNV